MIEKREGGSLWVNTEKKSTYEFVKYVKEFVQKKYYHWTPTECEVNKQEYDTWKPSDIAKIAKELKITLVPKTNLMQKYYWFFYIFYRATKTR